MVRLFGSHSVSRPTGFALVIAIAIATMLASVLRSRADPVESASVEVDPLDARLDALASNGIAGDATECVNDFLAGGGPRASWYPALLRAEGSPDPQKARLATILVSAFEGETLRADRLPRLVEGLEERGVARIPSLSVEILARRAPSEDLETIALGLLEAALHGSDPQARRLAALCLSMRRAREPGADGIDLDLLDPLLENLRFDRVPRNGLLALDLLSRDSSPEVRGPLIGMLDDADPQAVGMAALALVASGGIVGERLAECLVPNLELPYWGNDAVVMRTVAALEAAPLEEILVPLELALATAPVPPSRIADLPPLSAGDPEGYSFNDSHGREIAPDGSVVVVDPRVRGSEHRLMVEGDRFRRRLSRALFAHPEYRPSPAMLEFLGREMESDDVERNAWRAFERLEPLIDVPTVREFALEGLRSEDFQRAWLSLRLLGEPPASGDYAGDAARVLVDALDSSRGEYWLHPYSSEAIRSTDILLDHPGLATPELEAALDSPRSDQAWLAAYVLGATGRGARSERIVEILSHPERIVLPEFGTIRTREGPLLDSDPYVKFMIARGLGGLGPEASPAIRRATREGYPPYLPIFEILAEYVERPGVNPFELESAAALLQSPERLTFRLASVLLAIRNFDMWFCDLDYPLEPWSMMADDADRPAREAGWSEEMIRAAWEKRDDPFWTFHR